MFVHAPASNWQQLFGGEAPLLDKSDPRIRWVGRCPGEGGGWVSDWLAGCGLILSLSLCQKY